MTIVESQIVIDIIVRYVHCVLRNKELQMDLEQLLQKYGVKTSKALYLHFSAADAETFESKQWDYHDPDLLINRIKKDVDSLDPQDLSPDDAEWIQEIKWLWHHHAISCACANYGDREMAQYHSGMALKYHNPNTGNSITKLLYLLTRDRVADAEIWTDGIECEVESATAQQCLEDYKNGLFFKNPQAP